MSTLDTPSPQSTSASHAHEEPPPEEPKTPLWVTALGVALLISGAVGYLFVHEPAVEQEAVPEAAAEPAEEAEAKPATPAPTARRLPKGFPPNPAASGRPPRPRVPDLRNLRPTKPQ